MQEELRQLAADTDRTFEEVLELYGQAKKEVRASGKREGSNLFTAKTRIRLLELVNAPKPEVEVPEVVQAPKPSKASKAEDKKEE